MTATSGPAGRGLARARARHCSRSLRSRLARSRSRSVSSWRSSPSLRDAGGSGSRRSRACPPVICSGPRPTGTSRRCYRPSTAASSLGRPGRCSRRGRSSGLSGSRRRRSPRSSRSRCSRSRGRPCFRSRPGNAATDGGRGASGGSPTMPQQSWSRRLIPLVSSSATGWTGTRSCRAAAAASTCRCRGSRIICLSRARPDQGRPRRCFVSRTRSPAQATGRSSTSTAKATARRWVASPS